jgi:hypothetical protein
MPSASVIDFNKHKINFLISSLSQKYKLPSTYFIPLVNRLLEYNFTPSQIESEIDMFMEISYIKSISSI